MNADAGYHIEIGEVDDAQKANRVAPPVKITITDPIVVEELRRNAEAEEMVPLAQMGPKHAVHQLAGVGTLGASFCGWIMANSNDVRWYGNLQEVTCKACVRNRNPTWLRKEKNA